MLNRLTVITGVLVLVGSVVAHAGCGDIEIGRRNTRDGRKVGRKDVTDEASGVASTDVDNPCTAYSYAPVTALESSYPAIWDTASILTSDTTAQALFNTIDSDIKSRFPNDGPRGTANGNLSGVSYNATDPDCWWTWQGCTSPVASTGLAADWTTVPEPSTWGLTYDDGPNCSHNALYDYLLENQQKATMFYIGSNVIDWPLQAMRGLADGHQICVHTWSHQYMTSFANDVVFAELYYTQKIIKDLLGVTPLCWRPPFGDVDNRVRAIAAGLNLTTIIWSDDTEDWKVGANDGVTSADVDAKYEAIINKTTNGTYSTHGPIVLSHELTNYTMSEAITFYPKIKAAFQHVVPIAVAYNVTHPYVEQNVTYPTFDQYVAGTVNQTTGAATTTTSARPTSTSVASSSVAASWGSASASAAASSGFGNKASVSGAGRGREMWSGGVVGTALVMSLGSFVGGLSS